MQITINKEVKRHNTLMFHDWMHDWMHVAGTRTKLAKYCLGKPVMRFASTLGYATQLGPFYVDVVA